MKKYLTILFGFWLLASCSDYLDVKPKSQIDKDILFLTEEGFMEALNGVYSRASSSDIYGNELTFAFPDVLAQNYSLVGNLNANYQQLANFNYNDQNVVPMRNGIWNGLYSAIANANLLLDNIDAKEQIFSEGHYELIKGEALGLRGFFHLDLIRLYAPSYAVGSSSYAIPYVSSFGNQVSPQLTVRQALDSVIADLTAAKELLKDVDPIVDEAYAVGYTYDGDDGDELPDDESNEEDGPLFTQNRRHRLNYYAVCGALARAHLWRGNNMEAFNNANEVIESEKFPFTALKDLSNVEEEKQDRIFYPEILFGWAIPTKVNELRDRFERGSASLHVRVDPGKAIYELATVGAEDYRYKYWFRQISEGAANRLHLQKYHMEIENIFPLVAPAIRLSEMYYIAAETAYDFDQNLAWSLFNKIRAQRGIGAGYQVTSGTKEELLDLLVVEARKEFYGEGQIFYMYKRLNREIPKLDGLTLTPGDNYVVPMPDEEVDLGQRN